MTVFQYAHISMLGFAAAALIMKRARSRVGVIVLYSLLACMGIALVAEIAALAWESLS